MWVWSDMLHLCPQAVLMIRNVNRFIDVAGAWVSQGDGGSHSLGWLQGPEEAEEDQEGSQAPLLG